MGNIQDKTKQDCLDNLGGAGLKAVERAAQARKQLHSDLEKLIKEHINEVEATLTARIDTKLQH